MRNQICFSKFLNTKKRKELTAQLRFNQLSLDYYNNSQRVVFFWIDLLLNKSLEACKKSKSITSDSVLTSSSNDYFINKNYIKCLEKNMGRLILLEMIIMESIKSTQARQLKWIFLYMIYTLTPKRLQWNRIHLFSFILLNKFFIMTFILIILYLNWFSYFKTCHGYLG